jgi:hypothetical protein
LFVLHFRSQNTRFAIFPNSPGQGYEFFQTATPTSVEALVFNGSLEKMLLTNICSQLVVTRTRWIPNSQALGLRLSDLRFHLYAALPENQKSQRKNFGGDAR